MSDKLTNTEAARLAREVQGRCLTAARTQSSSDGERLDQLFTDVISVERWLNVEPIAFKCLHLAKEYASKGCYAMAAEEAGRAARILESRSANRGPTHDRDPGL